MRCLPLVMTLTTTQLLTHPHTCVPLPAGTAAGCPQSSCRCVRCRRASWRSCASTWACHWRLGRGAVPAEAAEAARRISMSWRPHSFGAWRRTTRVRRAHKAGWWRGRRAGQLSAVRLAAHKACIHSYLPACACAAGSVPNILNSVSKLQAFPWNDPPPAAGRQQQQQQQQQATAQSASAGQQQATAQSASAGQQQAQVATVLCPICLAPLADDELPGSSGGGADDHGHTSGGSGTAAAAAAAGCCLSCYQQVLGSSAESAASIVAALPAPVQQQMASLAAAGPRVAAGAADVEHLRAQIADFLL